MLERITQSVYASIDHINASINKDNPLPTAIDTKLFGAGSALDSLGLINLVVAVEDEIREQFQQSITLADDRALSREVSPFTTVKTLVEYIEVLLKEASNA